MNTTKKEIQRLEALLALKKGLQNKNTSQATYKAPLPQKVLDVPEGPKKDWYETNSDGQKVHVVEEWIGKKPRIQGIDNWQKIG